MLNNLTFHEVANIFPMMGDDEFAALKSDIAENGLREPIWTWNGQIIDGRNRYRACQELNITPSTREWDGQGNPVSFVVSLNLKRRHLNETQRATVAAKLANMTRGGDKPSKQDKNFDSANLQNRNITQPEAAKLLNVSTRLVNTVKEIEREAPQLVEKLAQGAMTANEAMREIKQERKRAMLESLPDAPTANGFTLDSITVCDIANIDMPAESVDMIFTDPPYHDEYLDCYSKLAGLAEKVLKPGAYCMTYVGKMFLPEILDVMRAAGLEYVWTMSVYHAYSNAKISKHNILENWRPILVFKKSGKSAVREWVQDTEWSSRNKEFHDWQQDVESPRKYIAAYTLPNDIVLDPFVGGGTTPTICKELKRHYVCFDVNPDAVKISTKRVNG